MRATVAKNTTIQIAAGRSVKKIESYNFSMAYSENESGLINWSRNSVRELFIMTIKVDEKKLSQLGKKVLTLQTSETGIGGCVENQKFEKHMS